MTFQSKYDEVNEDILHDVNHSDVINPEDVSLHNYIVNCVMSGQSSWDDEYVAPVDVNPVVHGEWIDKQLDCYKKIESRCSVCDWGGISNYDGYVDIFDFDFCPNCGADMR